MASMMNSIIAKSLFPTPIESIKNLTGFREWWHLRLTPMIGLNPTLLISPSPSPMQCIKNCTGFCVVTTEFMWKSESYRSTTKRAMTALNALSGRNWFNSSQVLPQSTTALAIRQRALPIVLQDFARGMSRFGFFWQMEGLWRDCGQFCNILIGLLRT